jgi:hypothetical protein
MFKTKVYFGLIDNGYTKELQAVIQNISTCEQWALALSSQRNKFH